MSTPNPLTNITNAFSSTLLPPETHFRPDTQQEIVQFWSSLPKGSGGGSPQVPLSIFSLNLLFIKICASDEDPLNPTSKQRNLYSASTRASSTVVVIYSQISLASSWRYVSHLVPYSVGDVLSGSELFLYLFPVRRVSRGA